MAPHADEASPLLRNQDRAQPDVQRTGDAEEVRFDEASTCRPRNWGAGRKARNIGVIAGIAILSPLASSMFAPGIAKIAESLRTDEQAVIAAQTGFVVMLGFGPLLLAPLSETFGRKILYLTCFGAFTLLQIPTALSPNIETLVALRTLTGFCGSVGIANGGGTISDMYEPSERAGIFGWYLLGPLLGPTLGPLLGGIILQSLDWPWVFWILAIICGCNVSLAFFLLEETYEPVLLAQRKKLLESKHLDINYYIDGADERPLGAKLKSAIVRPLRILFTQPIVLTMATYQALIFATTYSLYTQFDSIYGGSSYYGFSILQVGLLYLFPGTGFLIAVRFLVPRIDRVFNALTKKNNGEPQPEFRLPIANIGALLIPVSLFVFAWTVEYKLHWSISMVSTTFYGIGQVAIFNSVQNYYIDAFEKYAASAIAAGALFRSLMGGVVPLFVPSLIEKLGVGWGMSLFGFIGVLLAPSPLIFYYYGGALRKRFRIDLDKE